ncbi:MAG: methyltransferase domain-containing protein [Planctomycetales bacterium]|nr:methyltransferase domain-containing protein [Planctomycetales bacterium]NIM09232.1 methyltransferase domain-containing protein [Planctomycetales bacterium]NIN08703.1 methyltransferase domain-containing protein [Planctomycetales bacterium]NIN77818.1 methyltransferase domain-containing protein [Planctomycetales bacterium]NIO34995.1 methyltransferase domain-containing protein [Planctomycetales bacterium]
MNRIVERDLIHRVSYDQYRDEVRKVYGGARGAMLARFSQLSGHLQLGDRLLRKRRFDLTGAQQILDVGSGAGQILGHLLKYADPDARITAVDISHAMLRRARSRLKSDRPELITADLTRLPFDSQAFDCVTCGYVLEHLPNARTGLAELARVMKPNARMLLFTTEDSFGGAWTSRVWACRTYNRREIVKLCHELGLMLVQELWFSRMHKLLRAGGICIELRKHPPRHSNRHAASVEPVRVDSAV